MSGSITRERQRACRSEQILATALDLFCKRTIEDVSIEEVAKHAGTGPTTVYRYFSTKAELAVSSAVFYWKTISGKYVKKLDSPTYQEADGRAQMEQIMDIFQELFETEFSFLKFLYEFDSFIMKYHIPWDRLEEYEAQILDLKQYVTRALEKGLADGSLCFSWSVDETYFTLSHIMLSLMQKLAAGGRLLPSDERVSLFRQVKIAGELLILGLSNTQRQS
ncbi:MAG TPA: TetR/AcrR family transcriptional regulator [Candidatus Mediterraneibacter surreyensis]|nr:TetR/AcrR family transcriptional regulator [Candidatus Mediterraneibacter surreyensis]